ncbi:MAG: OmpH family outer membrane protein, partial [Bryobacteraceae bacterium]
MFIPRRPGMWLSVLASLAFAASAAAQAKVATINLQRAMLDTAELKKAQAELESRYKIKTDQKTKLESEIQELQTQLQKMVGKLTPQAEQDMQIQGQRKQRDLQRLVEDLQSDVDRDRTDILTKAGQRMTDVIRKLAEEKGLDLVMDVANTIYFKPALDITKEATAAYDKT